MAKPPPEPDNVVPIKPARGKGSRGPMTPEHKAKWLAAVRKSNNKPASGGFNDQMPRPAGAGWAGPARHGPPPDPTMATARAAPRRSKAEREAQADHMLDIMIGVALNPESPPALALAAAEKVRNQIVGTPVSRVVSASLGEIKEMAEDELDAELARLQGT